MLQRSKYNLCGLAVAMGLAVASPVWAEAPVWRGTDAATGQLASVEELKRLADDFPESASVRLRLINALMDAGSEGDAAAHALQIAMRGYAFSESAEAVLAEPLDLDKAAWFRAATMTNRAPIERSALLTTVPSEAQLVESLARDPATGNLYATTVVSRALYVKRGAAEWQRLDLDGAGSLSGIAYDAKTKLLWIASGNLDETPGDKVQAALLGFDPATGQVVRRLPTDGMGALGDVAVGDDGTVYAADPIGGVIYRALPGEAGLRALVAPGVFRSPQGMVAVPGKPLLIVSDYRYGLAALDIQTGKAVRIASAKPGILDGIDGLWRQGKSLVAVQNGLSPMRIVRLEMANDWLTVRNMAVLEQAHPSWTEPVGGTLAEGKLIYVATGQWGTFGVGGAVREGQSPAPTEIRTLPVGD